jgi:hypothetical protein
LNPFASDAILRRCFGAGSGGPQFPEATRSTTPKLDTNSATRDPDVFLAYCAMATALLPLVCMGVGYLFLGKEKR